MARNFQQTGNAASCGSIAACSGRTLVATPIPRECLDNGFAGNAQTVALAPSAVTVAGVMFQSAKNQPSDTSWASGNWIVRLNITTANTNITWVETYICRLNSACTSQATVGSLTGQSISLGTTGVKSMTISGTAQAGAGGDDLWYAVLVFTNAAACSQSFGFTPDQLLDTPLAAPPARVLAALAAYRDFGHKAVPIYAAPRFSTVVPFPPSVAAANPYIGIVVGQLLETRTPPRHPVPLAAYFSLVAAPAPPPSVQIVIPFQTVPWRFDATRPMLAVPQYFQTGPSPLPPVGVRRRGLGKRR